MGRYRSLQSIMLAEALKGITDNQTITAYGVHISLNLLSYKYVIIYGIGGREKPFS